MSEARRTTIPVTVREFLWVRNSDTGEVAVFVGPHQVQPQAADVIVVDDGKGGFREDDKGVPQRMISVTDNQYAVITNPVLVDAADDHNPNGPFKSGKNESRPLRNGTKAMVAGPCSFYLWPGQAVEVRDAHTLESNEYLVVEVYGEVDKRSPFYEITRRAAKIVEATTESSDGLMEKAPSKELRLGQRIVITGIQTNFYIPPSGVEVVPDTTVDASGKRMSPRVAKRLLEKMQRVEPAVPFGDASHPTAILAQYAGDEGLRSALEAASSAEGGMTYSYAAAFEDQTPMRSFGGTSSRVKDEAAILNTLGQSLGRSQKRQVGVTRRAKSAPTMGEYYESPLDEDRRGDESRERLDDLMKSDARFREAVMAEARKAALVRKAVVLSEKEFCVLIDADGKRQVHRGPDRVFPGPHDRFQTEGSRNRVYDAYELLPHRALWLRIISPITRDRLQTNLPAGVELSKDRFEPGDELLLHGLSAFFFPFNEVEILDASGTAVVGNDHSQVLIEEVGIDQKSGIYVRDMKTGEARLVRGKQAYLVDPRKEVQITRTVPPDDWNLMVAAQEPHKRTEDPVVTPWALSIYVPHNMAVLATSAEGQRIITGPRVELLGYEERLAPLHLSRGNPKTTDRTLKTCFLRRTGNRVSDTIRAETKDLVNVEIEVSLHVTFQDEARETWFAYTNYIGLLVNHIRSLLRGHIRTTDLLALWPVIEQTVRDVVLGIKDPESGERPGRCFDENGMIVTEVEVLNTTILDRQIAERMVQVQAQSVQLKIGDREAQERLESDRFRKRIDDEQRTLDRERDRLQHELAMARLELKAERLKADEQLQFDSQRRILEVELSTSTTRHEHELQTRQRRLEAEVVEKARRAEAQAGAEKLLHAEEQAHREAMVTQDLRIEEAERETVVAERQAIQPGLIEAITALGEHNLAASAAENMGLVSLIKGQDVATVLKEFLGGTRAARTLAKTAEKYALLGGGNGTPEDEAQPRR